VVAALCGGMAKLRAGQGVNTVRQRIT